MKNFIIAFLLFSGTVSASQAAVRNEPQVYFHCSVFAAESDEPLKDAKITIADTLGTVLTDSLASYSYTSMRQAMETVTYSGNVARKAKYDITVACPGYETARLRRTVAETAGSCQLGEIYLYRPDARSRKLDEVTVTATKVKMVMKGDTIEYDASAFRLPRGSMLDALIQALPGATLDDNGRITVNGEFVSTLLINGRKFFGDDPNVALRNLPNYTVKNIQVYRQEPEALRGLSEEQKPKRDKSADPLVMDVNLKREYMNGWLANFELGGGSSLGRADLRGMARFFAMRYTRISYIALFGTANNLNDGEKADSRGQWYKPSNTSGETTVERAGFEFNTDWRDQKYNGINTKIDFRRQTDRTARTEVGEEFIEGGNTFSRSRRRNRDATTSLNWSGEISRQFKPMRLWFEARAFYRHGTDRTATTNENGSSPISEIFVKPGTEEFERTMTYWREQTSGTRHDNYGGSLSFINSIYFSNIGICKSWLRSGTIRASATMDKTTRKESGTDRIVYPEPAAADNLDEALRSDRPASKHDFTVSGNISTVSWEPGTVSLTGHLNYTYSNKFDYGRRVLERENLTPSAESPENMVVDIANSYRTTRRDQLHRLNPQIWLELPRNFRIDANCVINFSRSSATDLRGGTEQRLRRSATTFDPRLVISHGFWNDGYGLNLALNRQLPDMLLLLDVRDSSNPLVLHLGNPGLKTTSRYSAELYFKKSVQAHARNMDFSLTYTQIDNAVAMARFYNRETGVVTLRPQNISGGRAIDGDFGYSRSFGRGDRFSVDNRLQPAFRHSVDYASDSDTPRRNAVDSYTLRDRLELRYDVCRAVSLRACCDLRVSRFDSRDALFVPFSYTEADYGLGVRATPLTDLVIDTDLTAYTRSGYGDPTMNRTDLVWNMTVSYVFGPAKQWTLKATGFDLLRQLPDVQRSVNAHGRSEVRINSQPAYALLTLTYRLDIKPRKSQK